MDQDRSFLDTFLIVIGALLAFTVAMYFLANSLANKYIDVDNSENPIAIQAVDDRLAPVGQVRTTDDPAPAPVKVATSQSGASQPAASSEEIDGKSVFEQTCFACHGTGAAGAPKMGDAAAWADRIAKGKPTLYKHALEGFTGQTGVMPAKGGRADISDAQVKAAVDYMIDQSK